MRFLILAALLFSTAVSAKEPLTLIVGAGVGGVSDVVARLITRTVPGVVINYTGADGKIAVDKFLASTDERMVLVGTSNLSALAATNRAEYAAMEPLIGLVDYDTVMVVPSTSPVKDIKDLIMLSATRPVFGGSSGIYTTKSLELVDKTTGTKTEIVGYKDRAALTIDLVAGRLDYSVVSIGNASFRHAQSTGKLRVIATLEGTRNAALPDVPTLKESGYAQVNGFGWSGIFVRRGIPQRTKDEIAEQVRAAMLTKEAEQLMELSNLRAYAVTASELNARVEREAVLFGRGK